VQVRRDVPLAPLTTLGVGGNAGSFAEIDAQDLGALVGQQVTVLGEGSNVVVADRGIDNLVVRYRPAIIEYDHGIVRAEAGALWDDVVAGAVARRWAGITCLSGIPGRVGAAPIQNIGAYGQALAEVLHSVTLFELTSGTTSTLGAEQCAFGYRTSAFKQRGGGFLITQVTLQLRPGGQDTLAYRDLTDRFRSPPDMGELRDAVLAIRRHKSMVLSPADPNSRSVGSFFLNPIVAAEVRTRLGARWPDLPAHPVGTLYKLSAAWLLERCGFHRGQAFGRVGLSANHVLAIVNRGGASAADVAACAAALQARVFQHTGVELTPEPRFLGGPAGA
jgi:UDP-N-acetylmuramate dehydrogenase